MNTLLQKLFGTASEKKPLWRPLEHVVLKDETLRATLHETGYAIAGRLDSAALAKLSGLYQSLHNFQAPNGGMFYSVYSRDIEYRTKVHNEINEILRPVYDNLFTNYKSVLNSFIVKVSGPESEFSLHQDSTGLDETKYSCLSVWIPLQDTNTTNGCICFVPHSHKMFSPYRGISFPAPFEAISDTVRKYLQPVELKAGDILLFDNRLVHNSVINSSGKDRVVVMSGIFPQEAHLLSVYKDPANDSNPIELIEQEDDYLLTFENFFHDCTCRPETGRSVGFVQWSTGQISEDLFLTMCRQYGLKPSDNPAFASAAEKQAIINEPVM